jgi:2-polyprenyl-6-methoxyphenol hydroxylase-like FAD-dependent oxidoreductase
LREYRDDGSYAERDAVERPDPTPAEPYHSALMIPQFLTEWVIRERLAEMGHKVEFGCELVGFEQGKNGVMARLAGPNGEKVVGVRYLVGADGGRSFVRGRSA